MNQILNLLIMQWKQLSAGLSGLKKIYTRFLKPSQHFKEWELSKEDTEDIENFNNAKDELLEDLFKESFNIGQDRSYIVRFEDVFKTPKWWGGEYTYYNKQTDKHSYCLKVLFMNAGGATSMHFHIKKHETLYVAQGNATIIILENKTETKFKLKPGDSFVLAPGTMHKICADDGDLLIVEASTYDHPTDSQRVY